MNRHHSRHWLPKGSRRQHRRTMWMFKALQIVAVAVTAVIVWEIFR